MKKILLLFALFLGLEDSLRAQSQFATFEEQKLWRFVATEVLEKHEVLLDLEVQLTVEEESSMAFIEDKVRYFFLMHERDISIAPNTAYFAYLCYLYWERSKQKDHWKKEIQGLRDCWNEQLQQWLGEYLTQLSINTTTHFLLAKQYVCYQAEEVEDWTENIHAQLKPELAKWRKALTASAECSPELAKTLVKFSFLPFKEFKTLYLD